MLLVLTQTKSTGKERRLPFSIWWLHNQAVWHHKHPLKVQREEVQSMHCTENSFLTVHTRNKSIRQVDPTNNFNAPAHNSGTCSKLLTVNYKPNNIEMQSQDIIARVIQPTDWVNSLVIRQKDNGRLRVYLDPKDLNKAIIREHHPIPALKEITPKLAGAKLSESVTLVMATGMSN